MATGESPPGFTPALTAASVRVRHGAWPRAVASRGRLSTTTISGIHRAMYSLLCQHLAMIVTMFRHQDRSASASPRRRCDVMVPRISRWRVLGSTCALLVFLILVQAPRPTALVRAQASCSVDETRLTLDGEEQAAVELVNLARGQAGLAPLTVSDALLRNALWKSTDLAVSGSLAQDDGFRTWFQRFADCGYDTSRSTVSQIVGRGLPTGAGHGNALAEHAEHT